MEVELDPIDQRANVSVSVTGTPYTLHHDTTRPVGYVEGATFELPLIDGQPPEDIVSVKLEVEVAGQMFFREFEPEPDLSFEFQWDGTDAYGRGLAGSYPVDYRVGYEYPQYYVITDTSLIDVARENADRFGIPAGELEGAEEGDRVPTRQNGTYWTRFPGTLTGLIVSVVDPREIGLGGFQFDVHHDFDPVSKLFRYGDGRTRALPPHRPESQSVVEPVAGIPPDARLGRPYCCDVGPDGSVYVGDGSHIRRQLPDGSTQTVAGGTGHDASTEFAGEDANSIFITQTHDVAVDSRDRVSFANDGHPTAYRITQGAVVPLPDGSSLPDRQGDRTNGSEIQPRALATGPDDEVYVARAVDERFEGGARGVVQKVTPEGDVELVAGTGERTNRYGFDQYAADGEPSTATEALLCYPTGISCDDQGRVYVADLGYDVVFRIDGDAIEVVAGNGSSGYSGDGGPATEAAITGANTIDVAVDGDGGFYVTDDARNYVRHVDDGGTIRTVAGSASGDYHGDGGPATEASFVYVVGIAGDGQGGFYVADQGGRSLRHVDADGTIEYRMGATEEVFRALLRSSGSNYGVVYAGDGGPATRAAIGGPSGVAFGPDGELYISDYYNHVVRKIAPDGTISTIAGTGTAGYSGDGGQGDEARIDEPERLAVGSDGSVYVCESGNGVLRKVRPDGTITTIYEESETFSTWSLALDADDNLYLWTGDDTVKRVDESGSATIVLGGGSEPIADGVRTAQVGGVSAWDIAHDGDDGLYLVDDNRVFHATFGGTVTQIAGRVPPTQSDPGGGGWIDDVEFQNLQDLERAPDGSVLAVDSHTNRILRFTQDGSVEVVLNTVEDLELTLPIWAPERFAVDSAGDVYVADLGNQAVRKVNVGDAANASVDLIPTAEGDRMFEFTDGGRHEATYESLTGELLYEFEYDDENRLTSITDASGNETVVERDGDGTPTAIASPTGLRTELSLDGDGYLESVTNPAGEDLTFAYDDGQITEATDLDGATTTFDYDDLGLLVERTDPSGATTTLSRTEAEGERTVTLETGAGRRRRFTIEQTDDGTKLTDEATGVTTRNRGSETVFDYPDAGSVTASARGDPRFGLRAPVLSELTTETTRGSTKTVSVDRSVSLADQSDLRSLTSLEQTVSIDGRTKRERYADGNRELQTSYSSGRTVTDGLGTAGQLESSTLSDRETATFAYDAAGRLNTRTETTGSATREWATDFDGDGFRESATDPRGETRTFETDAVARLRRLVYADGDALDLDTDPLGRLTELTTPDGSTHSFSYDDNGNPDGYSPPGTDDGWGFEYDADGLLERLDPPSGETVANTYDDTGRLETKSLPGGTISYSYQQSTGAVTEVEGPNGSTIRRTLDWTLPTREALQGPVSGAVSRRFDGSFRPTEIAVDGDGIAYDYDDDSLVTAAGACTIDRNDAGLATRATVAGVTRSWERTGYGEVSKREATVGGSRLYAVEYQRNERGWITEATETVDGATTTREFDYDARGRLTTVREDGSVVESYDYDGNDNRTTVERDGETESPSYDERDRLESAGDRTYTYDADGRLTEVEDPDAGGTTSYEYDARGHLTGATLADGTELEYVLDPLGRRVGKRVDGTLERGWLYRDGLRPIAELDGDGNVTARFVYGSHPATPDYVVKGGTTYVLLCDHVGSPRLVVDADSGDVVQRIEYDAFGRVVEDTDPGFQPFGFAGGQYDPDTGLVRFGQREYDPVAGRFTRADPLAFRGGYANLYVYAGNDPVNRVDRTGLIAPAAPMFVNGALDGGIEMGAQLVQHGRVTDWGDVAQSTATGFATGAVPTAAIAKKAKIAEPLVDGAVNAAGAVINTVAENYEQGCSLLSGVLGAAAQGFGFGATGSSMKATADAGPSTVDASDLGPTTTDVQIDVGMKSTSKAAGSLGDGGGGGGGGGGGDGGDGGGGWFGW